MADGSAKKKNNSKTGSKSTNSARKKSTSKASSSKTSSRKVSAATSSRKAPAKTARSRGTGKRGSSPSVGEEIAFVLILALSFILLLSNFELAGKAGYVLKKLFFGLFGIIEYIFPLLLAGCTVYYAINRRNREVVRVKIAAIAVLMAMMTAYVTRITNDPEVSIASLGMYFTESAKYGAGGGLIGGIIVKLLSPIGFFGTMVLLTVISIICAIIISERSLIDGFAFIREKSSQAVHTARGDIDAYRTHSMESRQRMYEELEERRNDNKSYGKPSYQEDLGADEGLNLDKDKEELLRARQELRQKRLEEKRLRREEKAKIDEARKLQLEQKKLLAEARKREVEEQTRILEEQRLEKLKKKEEIFKQRQEAFEEKYRKKRLGVTDNLKLPEEPENLEEVSINLSSLIDGSDIKDEFSTDIYDPNQVEKLDFNQAPTSGDIFGNFEDDDNQVLSIVGNEPDNDNLFAKPKSGSQDYFVSKTKPVSFLDDLNTYETSQDEKESYENADQEDKAPNYDSSSSDFDEENRSLASDYDEEDKNLASDLDGEDRSLASDNDEEDTSLASDFDGEDTSSALMTDYSAKEREQKAKKKVAYQLPKIDLLDNHPVEKNKDQTEEHQYTARRLQQTLQNFGVKVNITGYSCGPTVTRYEMQPEMGVKVSKIVSLTDDIKLNLAASDIIIQAPIPGKAAVGIEVPNKNPRPVYFREMMKSKEFAESKSLLSFGAGEDIAGQIVVADAAKMPHLLIAGATGSGKSVCINTIIMSILYKAKPDEVKMIMIDPKMVELSVYNGIPHLLTPVVTDAKKAVAALTWAVSEMTDRYQKFARFGVRDINHFNKRVAGKPTKDGKLIEKMPQIVIIIDELADLMMVAPSEIEDLIVRIAQLARACGMHLVIATQRPSANVITGLIKANVPSRIALSVSSSIDSRIILDMNGAEKLLGHGDMLFFPSGYPEPVRVQGAYVSDDEVTRVVDFLKAQNPDEDVYNHAVELSIEKAGLVAEKASDDDRDSYFDQAARLVIKKKKASISMVQRALKVGYNRAGRIVDQLCEARIVGPEKDNNKPRDVLVTMEQYENMMNE